MRVLLTNCTRNAGVIVARALARAGHEVVGADDRRMPFGMRSRYIRRQYLVPAEEDELADALLEILRRERVDVLLPFAGVGAVAARRAEFAALTEFLVPEEAALTGVSDKAALPALCERFAIGAPRVYVRGEAEDCLRRAGVTLVVKPRRSVGGGAGIRFVQTARDLGSAVEAIDPSGADAVISEYVPGGTDRDRALHLLFDRDSRLVASFSMRKTAQSPPRVGITAAAVSTHDVDLIERVTPMLEELRWQGPLDVEWKLDPRDGVAKLIEINPRFSGAIGFPIALGVDMIALYVAASSGARLAEARPSGYPVGVRYINPGPYLHALPARMCAEGAWTALRQIRTELSGTVVVPAWEIGDPAPHVGKMLHGALAPFALRGRRDRKRHHGAA